MTALLEQEYGTYTLVVYPSQETEDTYTTNRPVLYMLVTIAVFAATCLTFVAFSILVERRQKKVMGHAVISGAIVSSLFPERVKERLYKNTAAAVPSKSKKADAAAQQWKATEDKVEGMDAVGAGMVTDTAPIAEEFPETTVLFADLSGFTAWSTARTPVQVFTLLETLYAAFDAIAMRRKVFKVETVGDCYVAVTGLPNRRCLVYPCLYAMY